MIKLKDGVEFKFGTIFIGIWHNYEFEHTGCANVFKIEDDHLTVRIYHPHNKLSAYSISRTVYVCCADQPEVSFDARVACKPMLTGRDQVPVHLELSMSVGDLANLTDLTDEHSLKTLARLVTVHSNKLVGLLPEVKNLLLDRCPELRDYLETAYML